MIDQGFECGRCGQRHAGVPFSYGADAPAYWRDEFAADERSVLDEELCVIQAEHYFVRARLIIPVHDAGHDFEWGIWSTLSRPNFTRMVDMWETPGREAEPAYFGWLATELPVYPASTLNLKLMVHTGVLGERPHVLVEPTDHPLAVEQREGITMARVQEIASLVMHSGT